MLEQQYETHVNRTKVQAGLTEGTAEGHGSPISGLGAPRMDPCHASGIPDRRNEAPTGWVSKVPKALCKVFTFTGKPRGILNRKSFYLWPGLHPPQRGNPLHLENQESPTGNSQGLVAGSKFRLNSPSAFFVAATRAASPLLDKLHTMRLKKQNKTKNCPFSATLLCGLFHRSKLKSCSKHTHLHIPQIHTCVSTHIPTHTLIYKCTQMHTRDRLSSHK